MAPTPAPPANVDVGVNNLFQWIANFLGEMRWWVIILPWETAIRIRLGKDVTPWGPGWHVRIPFVDEVRMANTRLRIGSVPPQTLTTVDGKTITVASMVAFRIDDLEAALLTLQQPEVMAAAFAQAAVAEYIQARNVRDIDVGALEEASRKSLDRFAKDRGLAIEWVRIVDFAVVKTYRLLQDQGHNRAFTYPGAGESI